MKEFITNRENHFLKITDRIIALSGKDFHVWEAKAENITTLYFTDRNCSFEVKANVSGVEETFNAQFTKEIYVQVKEYFTKQLMNVKVRDLSRARQMSVPLTMAILLTFLIGTLFYFAKGIENTGENLEGGTFNAICNFMTDKFGSEGILLGGGALIAIFGAFALKAFILPKKGASVTFKHGNQVMNFNVDS